MGLVQGLRFDGDAARMSDSRNDISWVPWCPGMTLEQIHQLEGWTSREETKRALQLHSPKCSLCTSSMATPWERPEMESQAKFPWDSPHGWRTPSLASSIMSSKAITEAGEQGLRSSVLGLPWQSSIDRGGSAAETYWLTALEVGGPRWRGQ